MGGANLSECSLRGEFDNFVDKVFDPMLIAADNGAQQPEGAGAQVQQPKETGHGAGLGQPEVEGGPGQPECSEVESVLYKRVEGGTTQYKAKWEGWDNRYNCWRGQGGLGCKGLVDKYKDAYLGLGQPKVVQCVLALVLSLATVTAGVVADGRVQGLVDVQTKDLHCQLQGLGSLEAVGGAHGQATVRGCCPWVCAWVWAGVPAHGRQETESAES